MVDSRHGFSWGQRALRRLLRILLQLILAAIFVGIPALFVYAKIFGIGFGLPERIGAALSTPAFETRIGRLSFDPLHGLVAENLRVFSREEEGTSPLVEINRLSVSPNLAALLSRRLVIDRVALDDASAEIPLPVPPDEPPGAPPLRLKVREVRAEVVFLENQFHLTNFDAVIEGIHFRGSGSLQSPADFSSQDSGEEKASPSGIHNELPPAFLRDLSRIITRIRRVKHQGQPPLVTFQFHADGADWDSLEIAPLRVDSGPIVGEGWRLESIHFSGRFARKRLTIERLEASDLMGTLRVWGAIENQAADFQAECSLDPRQFARAAKSLAPLADLSFQKPPSVTLRGHADFHSSPPAVSATGSLSFPAFSFRGVPFDHLRADFAWKDRKLFLRDVEASQDGHAARGDALLAEGEFRMQASGLIKPTRLAPLLDEKTRHMLSLMKFRDAAGFSISLEGTKPSLAEVTGSGSIRLGKTAMRDVWIDRAESAMEIANGAVTYRDFTVEREGGVARGTFTYDFRGQQVRLARVVSTVDPVAMLMWADPRIAETVSDYRFRQPPLVKVDGVIHMKDLARNKLSVVVESAAGFDYDLLGKSLPFGKTSATVNITGMMVKARVLKAALFDGEVALTTNVSIDPARPVFDVDAEIRRVDFPKLTKLYFNFDTSKGVASGKIKFKAPIHRARELQGGGSLRVERGNVFAIPILGPLSDIINLIIPGAGYQTARLATCDFTIANEKISTNNLEIEGVGFSLFVTGDLFFMENRMDMSARINARGLPGLVLFPVSKLFEYTSTGTMSSPEWRPKIIPRPSRRSGRRN